MTGEKSIVRIAEFSELWEGRTIDGAFPLRKFLGAGETSAVYLTTHGARNAAIKLVPADSVPSADAQLSLWREAHKLSHPNLIRILATGRAELDDIPLLYIVTERAEEDLSQVLPDRSLTAVETREMLEPTLSALEYLHRQGFLHAHLKPSNIMAVEDCLKISSDGIRRAGEMNSAPTPYDPPERTVSAAGDIWSLGVTLVEVLTQCLPSNGSRPAGFAGPLRRYRARLSRAQPRGSFDHPANPESPRQPRARRGAAQAPFTARRRMDRSRARCDRRGRRHHHAFRYRNPPRPPHPPRSETLRASSHTRASAHANCESNRPESRNPSRRPHRNPNPQSAPAPVSGIIATARAGNHGPGPQHDSWQSEIQCPGRSRSFRRSDGCEARSSGGSKYFSERALAAVRQWKFEPVSVNGSEVGQRWRVRFEFVKTGTKIQPQRLSP